MSAPDRTDPSDRPTWPAPHPGARVCGQLWCSMVALPGSDRCDKHVHTSPTLRMHAVVVEAFCEASRGEAAE